MPTTPINPGDKPANANIESNLATEASIPSASSMALEQNPSIQTKTEAEEAADRLYEERIEEEYAKREGGA
jgi:hypothetical protein